MYIVCQKENSLVIIDYKAFCGGDEIRKRNTNPSRNHCFNDFYCVFLQVEFYDSAQNWAIIGPRFNRNAP